MGKRINMKKYIGVKLIDAVEMNIDGKQGYRVVYHEDYESWSPKDVFEEAYRLIDGMTFGLAIEAMKKGYKVGRRGWNGKGMFIAISDNLHNELLPAEKFWNPHARQAAIDNGGYMEVLPTVIMKTADNKILMGWLASQSDMLAEDWRIVD